MQLTSQLSSKIKDLSQDMIEELKATKTLSPLVLNVLYGALVVFGEQANLLNARKMIEDEGFLGRMTDFDVSTLTKKKHFLLDKYVHKKEFSPSFVARFSSAATFICEWLISMHEIDARHLFEDANRDQNLENEQKRFKNCVNF